MSNPKVFEFAKEVGMTPLALMDKIREWQLPVKSHMSELDPEVLSQIKIKLSGQSTDEKSEEAIAKPKKAATRKVASSAPKKPPVAANKVQVETEDKPAVKTRSSDSASKNSVIRRKATAVEPEEPFKAKVISRPKAEVVEADEVQEAPMTPSIVSTQEAVVASSEVVSTIKEEIVETKPVVAAAPAAAVPSRKKEVVVGGSGLASVSTPASSAPKRNIVGRMDLSRVQPQSGGGAGGGQQFRQQGPRQGGYNSGGGQMGGAGGAGRVQTGPARTSGRNLRAGFVAATAPVEIPTGDFNDRDNKRDLDRKSKKLSNFGGGAGASQNAREKEKEEENQDFNAVEFRKREMVFQPRKKKDVLGRAAMQTQITTPKASKRILKVYGSMKVSDIANEMGLKANQLIKALMTNGVMANINTSLDYETIALILPEFDWEAQNVQKTAEEVVDQFAFGDLSADPVVRPPVVTIMGHVDHGKTSLLDAIRSANVASGEAGGITQHIGAYSVKLSDEKVITFLDTPGHEAFTAMRARGANATDIAVIVVAADDGMMPQTAEAINHAKAAKVPIIVAVNKMDKPGANPDRIKQQLTELEIVPEEWGGNTIFCEVSALKKTGLKELLENIYVLSELAELKANPKKSGSGLVIEAKLEKGKGPVATLLIKDGTVKVGQYIVAGSMRGRVRSLVNDKGDRLQEVGPGYAAEVLGLEGVPAAGDRFDIVKDEDVAEQVVTIRKEQAEAAATPNSKMSLEDIFSKVTKGDVKELAIVLKADVHGSLEAIQGMLNKLSTAEVKTRVIHAAVGGVSESDVLLASTAKGVIIGFNVRPDLGAQSKAKNLGIDIRTYSIVYELIDQMKLAMTGLLTPDIVEKVMGTVEVRNTFSVPKVGVIAGCFILDGKVQRSNIVRLVREGKIIYEGKISSLKRFKDDAKEVAQGFECGIGIENFNDIKVGDIMEAFVKEEKARSLDASTN